MTVPDDDLSVLSTAIFGINPLTKDMMTDITVNSVECDTLNQIINCLFNRQWASFIRILSKSSVRVANIGES